MRSNLPWIRKWVDVRKVKVRVNMHVAITRDYNECKVEAPIYSFLVEPCYSKPVPAEVVKCVRRVAESAGKVEGLVQELQECDFEIRKVVEGAEAYWSKVDGGTRGHVRVYLSPRTSYSNFKSRVSQRGSLELRER